MLMKLGGRTDPTIFKSLLFQVDPWYQLVYAKGLAETQTPASADTLINKRESRFYNLIGIYNLVSRLEGRLAEVGCWKGLSAYILNSYIREQNPAYLGQDFWIVDSFEGLSKPTLVDLQLEHFIPAEVVPCDGKAAGSFHAELEQVRWALKEFPEIQYAKGWLPAVLGQCPQDSCWKFVHIDLDLYQPIKEAFNFFSPRMVRGGIIVFDDYGSLGWPGARLAVDEIATDRYGSLVKLSTGQAVWQAPID
jgi:O-methyltransferase